METNSASFFQAMLGVTASLMAISITLVALVPALIEIARASSPDYFSGEQSSKRIRSGLSRLRYTIWIYGGAMMLSAIELLLPAKQTIIIVGLIAVAALFLAGTIFLIITSHILTSEALKVL